MSSDKPAALRHRPDDGKSFCLYCCSPTWPCETAEVIAELAKWLRDRVTLAYYVAPNDEDGMLYAADLIDPENGEGR